MGNIEVKGRIYTKSLKKKSKNEEKWRILFKKWCFIPFLAKILRYLGRSLKINRKLRENGEYSGKRVKKKSISEEKWKKLW